MVQGHGTINFEWLLNMHSLDTHLNSALIGMFSWLYIR